MKQIYFLIVLFGALLFCACEKENMDPLVEDQAQSQTEESALKAAKTNGLVKIEPATPLLYWARAGAGAPLAIPATKEYGIVYFYVNSPEDAVPDDYNLKNFSLDPRTQSPGIEWAVEGALWFIPEILYSDIPVPMHTKLKGKGAVPFWIITRQQVEDLFNAPGELITVPMLEALNPTPAVGLAISFTEILRPWGGGAKVAGIQTSAHGIIVKGNDLIEEGSSFNFSYHTKSTTPGILDKYEVKFNILDKHK